MAYAQQDWAEDFVIATGLQIAVREFVNRAAYRLGIELEWVGTGVDEIAKVKSVEGANIEKYVRAGDIIVRVDPRYFRPAEVETLLGDPTKAHAKLGWCPSTTLEEMVNEMVTADFQEAQKEQLLIASGFEVSGSNE